MTPMLFRAVVSPDWLDENGHMNLMWWTYLYDRAAQKVLVDAGLAGTELGGFAVTSTFEYRAEAKPGDVVEVRGSGLKLGRSSFTLEMSASRDEAPLGTASMRLVCVDMRARGSLPLPAFQRAALEVMAAAWPG